MGAVCFSETFVITYKTTWCDNPEDRTLMIMKNELGRAFKEAAITYLKVLSCYSPRTSEQNTKAG
jgi:hypothetical protein